MSENMQIEIDRAVNKFTPPIEVGGGFLSREDIKTFARKAVTPIPYNASLLVQVWNTQPQGENHV